MRYSAAKTLVNQYERLERKLKDAEEGVRTATEEYGPSKAEREAAQVIEWQQEQIAEHKRAIEALKDGIRRSEAEIERRKKVVEQERERREDGKGALEAAESRVARLKAKIKPLLSKLPAARERVQQHAEKLAKRQRREEAAAEGVEVVEVENALEGTEVRVKSAVEIPPAKGKLLSASRPHGYKTYPKKRR